MGEFGIAIVGAAVGAIGCWLHPRDPSTPPLTRSRMLACVAAAAIAAALIKWLAEAVGIVEDGQSLEWLIAILAAASATSLAVRWPIKARGGAVLARRATAEPTASLARPSPPNRVGSPDSSASPRVSAHLSPPIEPRLDVPDLAASRPHTPTQTPSPDER